MKAVNIAGALLPSQPTRIGVGSHIRCRLWSDLQYLQLNVGKQQAPRLDIVGVVAEIENDGGFIDITVVRDGGNETQAGFTVHAGG